jgi:hypothetical protein
LLTYNHQAYIGQALASVLSQQSDFPFEVIVTEDCSTDDTGDIVQVAAASHPDTIRLVRSPVNLNTNVVTTRALDMAQGEYVAFLDGDDYWTSVDKLQKQVSFLDQNTGFSICFHDVVMIDSDGQVIESSFHRTAPAPDVGEYDDIVRSCYIAGPSAMIRRNAIAELPPWFKHAHFGDWPLYILAAEHGSIGFLPEVLGAYRVHAGGYWSGMDEDERLQLCVRFLQLVWEEAPPSRRPALDSALAQISSELLVSQIRKGRWSSAVTTLAIVLAAARRQRRLRLVLAVSAKVRAELHRRLAAKIARRLHRLFDSSWSGRV